MIMYDIYIIFKTPMGLQILFLPIENKDTAQNVPLILLRELSQFYIQLIHYELLASEHLFFPLETELCTLRVKLWEQHTQVWIYIHKAHENRQLSKWLCFLPKCWQK